MSQYPPLQMFTEAEQAEMLAANAKPPRVTKKEALEALTELRLQHEVMPKSPLFNALERYLKGE